ncbi:MAG: hypothetical protein GXY06_01020 [Clostridiaceae bacterium]|nr:hypothetical protein [Clostridiaceae bacterium]
MKTTWTRVITVILLLSLSFSITACQRKSFSLDEFVDISDKNGIDQVVNMVGSEEYEIAEFSRGTTDTYTLQYVRYVTADAAQAKYDSIRDGYKLLMDDIASDQDMTLISTDQDSMQRMVISVSYTDEYGQDKGVYAATVLFDDVLIDMAANANDLTAIEKIDGILKDLGYYY